MGKKFLQRRDVAILLSIGTILVVWQILAMVINSPLILPLPKETLKALLQDIGKPLFWQHVGATACRSLVAFGISVVVGTLLGAAAGASDSVHNLLDFPLAMMRATPVVSFILLALFWFGSSLVPIFVAMVMSLPVMISAVETGIKNTNKDLIACCRVYGFSTGKMLRHLYFPSCKPYFFSGSLAAFGLSWKVVAAAEVISLPHRSAGTLLQNAKVHLETAQVFAITLVLVILSFVLESLFSVILHRRGLLTGGKATK
ncbi:MAG: ABC transporter permease subunit [Treponema sp.]|nr:ABC transporter permease subunit [Treponema sp.]